MSNENKDDNVKEVMQAVTELREMVEKSVKNPVKFPLDEEKVAKINKLLDGYEDENQKRLKDTSELQEKTQKLEDEVKRLETLLSRPGNGNKDDDKVSAKAKAFLNFSVKGFEGLTIDEQKLLQIADDTQGGYLVPADYNPELIKNITEVSPLRQFAKVRTTTGKEYQMPKRTGLLNGGWVGEAQQDNLSNSTYGLEAVPVHKMQVTVPITNEMLHDSVFNMESEIMSDLGEAFGLLEGQAFIFGNGIKKPEGILSNVSVPTYNMGSAAALNADGIILAQGQVKTGYNLSYLLNRKTLAALRVLKESGTGRYLWGPSYESGRPGTIAGLPYVEVPDMPDIAAGTVPIALGDWKRAYLIVDNTNLEMIRDPFTQKRLGIVEFTGYKRVGGQVILPEAILKLVVSA